MEAIRARADERRVVVVPGLGPIAAAQVTERVAELVGHDQTDASNYKRVLPALPRAECAANAERDEHQWRPALHERRRLGEPAELFDLGNFMVMDEECDGAINEVVAD